MTVEVDEVLSKLNESFNLYRQSPANFSLEMAYIALDRANELALRCFLVNVLEGVPEEKKKEIAPADKGGRSSQFEKLLDDIDFYGGKEKYISSSLREKISKDIHKKTRNPAYHMNFPVLREEYEIAAFASMELFKNLFGFEIPFQVAPPLAVQMAPFLEQQLFGRDHDIELLKQILLGHDSKSPNTAVIKGMAGVGKTTLVSKLCYEPDIRKRFCEGVLWLSIDEQDNEESLIFLLADTLRVDLSRAQTPELKRSLVKMSLSTKSMLIVLDNIQKNQETLIQNLLLGGKNCFHILTTRDNEISNRFGSARRTVQLKQLSANDSQSLLLDILGDTVDRSMINHIAAIVGHNPLGLNLVGRLVHDQNETGCTAGAIIASIANEKEVLGLKADNERTLEAVISVSYQALTPDGQDCFRKLGVFHFVKNSVKRSLICAVWRKSSAAVVLQF